MSANRDSQEQLQQMAQRAGLRLSEADMAFVTSFRPYSANQLALAALQSSSQVHVTNSEEQIAFLPREGSSVGLIFYPGARVEAEAYAVNLNNKTERKLPNCLFSCFLMGYVVRCIKHEQIYLGVCVESNLQDRQRAVVLIVDDNPAIRDMVSWALELDGFEAAEVADGQEALAWMDNAAREGRYPSVVLLDLSMPHMDGDTFLQSLQVQWEKARPIPPVIIITAAQNASQQPHAHVNQVIIKPFHVRDLLDAIRDLVA